MSQAKITKKATLDDVARRYTVKTTDYLESIIDQGEGAVAMQYRPDVRELENLPNENGDPIGDNAHSPVKGIVHRYPDRVLLKPHHACAVYCRFCFRRDMVGRNGEALNPFELEQALSYIRDHHEVMEVILTGGDPLALSPRRLKIILDALDDMPHVHVIRIHTRVPVAAPDLIADDMLGMLSGTKTTLYTSIHCNHAAEIEPSNATEPSDAAQAIAKMRERGLTLVSQSVLLKGVNDSVEVLDTLFRLLLKHGVKPYYLHHPDRAEGTGHFRVSITEGLAIYSQLRGRLSGMALPHYMLDIPGGFGKISLDSSHHVKKLSENAYELHDFQGRVHYYKDELK